MTPLLENKNAIVYGGAAPRAARSPVRSQARGRGSSSPAGCSTGFRRPPSEARYPVSHGSGPQALHWHDSIASIE